MIEGTYSNKDEWDYWNANPQFREKYRGKLVAILRQEIIDADSEEELYDKLEQKGWIDAISKGRLYLRLSVDREEPELDLRRL